MDAAPTVVPEPGHARPEGTVPDRAGARRAPAAPARAAAARPGPMGAGRRPRTERVPGGGARRPGPVEPAAVEARPRPRLAPAAAHPAADHDPPRRSGALPGRVPGPARRGLGRPRSARLAEGPAVTLIAVWTMTQEEPWVVV